MRMISFARIGFCAAAALVLACGCDTIRRARTAQAPWQELVRAYRRICEKLELLEKKK